MRRRCHGGSARFSDSGAGEPLAWCYTSRTVRVAAKPDRPVRHRSCRCNTSPDGFAPERCQRNTVPSRQNLRTSSRACNCVDRGL
jgi:hypothetical protein